MSRPFLSKSKYLIGLQCLRYLWLSVNDPDSVPPPDASTQHVFDQGHEVEELARRLFPDGTEVPFEDFRGNLKLTRQLLKERRTLFQAGVMSGSIYSRLDVLRPAEADKWDIIEIKSSTRVKSENVDDVSFQKYCCERQGIGINHCYLMHINSRYVKSGDIDPAQLFVCEDITEQVQSVSGGIEDRIKEMQETIASDSSPDIRLGVHCKAPYECPVVICRESLPENNILELYRGGKKAYDLLYDGVLRLSQMPDDLRLTKAQSTQKWCDTNSCNYADSEAIGAFLRKLKYPVHYMDFETFNTAIPLFDGVRPYQQVPFQFSMHVVDRPGTMPWPCSFLADGPDDPRPQFLRKLKEAIGSKGSIVVYNQVFEEDRLKELAEAYPEERDWTDGVRSRLVDLLQPFRSFDYYDPAQKGSASIKHVLPALTGKSYDDLEIGKGDEASLAYLAITYGDVAADEREKIRDALITYCGQDTLGMVWIVDKLREVCGVVGETVDSRTKRRTRR